MFCCCNFLMGFEPPSQQGGKDLSLSLLLYNSLWDLKHHHEEVGLFSSCHQPISCYCETTVSNFEFYLKLCKFLIKPCDRKHIGRCTSSCFFKHFLTPSQSLVCRVGGVQCLPQQAAPLASEFYASGKQLYVPKLKFWLL